MKRLNERKEWMGYLDVPFYEEPQEGDLILRPSTIASLMLCPSRVKLQEHDDYDDLPSEPLWFGSTAHRVLEYTVLHPHTRPPSDDQIIHMMFDVWREDTNQDPEPYLTALRVDLTLEELQLMVRNWMKDVYPYMPGNGVILEKTLWAPLGTIGERSVWLHGTPDLIDLTEGRITDWKTSGKGWPSAKKFSEIQPHAYRYLVYQHYGQLVTAWTYWIYNRKTAEWKREDLNLTRNQAQLTGFLQQAWAAATLLDSGAYLYNPTSGLGSSPRGWWCTAKYCNAWDICPGKWLVNDGRATETRTKGWE